MRPSHWDEMWYSLVVSLFAGLVTACLGQIAAFLMSRELPFKGVIDFLAVLPGALPRRLCRYRFRSGL